MAKLVFLIDDDQDDLDIIKESISLVDASAVCYSFTSAVQAIEHISHFPHIVPELVLTDFNMPMMSGEELVRKLRANQRFNDTKIVVLSTSMPGHFAALLVSAGANFTLQKPSSIDGFNSMLAPLFRPQNRSRDVAQSQRNPSNSRYAAN